MGAPDVLCTPSSDTSAIGVETADRSRAVVAFPVLVDDVSPRTPSGLTLRGRLRGEACTVLAVGHVRRRGLLFAAAVAAMPLLFGGCATPNLTVTTLLDGLDHPWDLGFLPDGTIVFTERPGDISAIVNGHKQVLHHPADVVAASEAGMMGLAVDPNFASNRRIYTCFASSVPSGAANDVRVVRWTVDAGYAGLSNRTDILTGAPVNASGQLGRHSGCRPRFGPDGYLWIGTGDAAVGTNPMDPQSLGGKVLRIGSDGNPALGNINIAPWDARIHTYGHRNVQGLAFRPSDGRAFAMEHGPDRNDELNALFAGGNYGWDPVPGYNESAPMTDFAKFPTAIGSAWWSGSQTIAPSGITFLSGSQWGAWNGAIAAAALKGQQVRVFTLNGDAVSGQASIITNQGRLRSAVLGPDQNLYLTTDNGSSTDKILKVVPSLP
jgi:glucose/arabinose dehydrogenase